MIDRSIASEAVFCSIQVCSVQTKMSMCPVKALFLKNVSGKSIKNDFLSGKSVALRCFDILSIAAAADTDTSTILNSTTYRNTTM